MNGSKTAGFIEYLDYFSESGEFTVTVSFENSSAKIATLSTSQKSIEDLKMILAAQETPTMSFDEYHGSVRKILLDPIRKTIHMNVQLLQVKN